MNENAKIAGEAKGGLNEPSAFASAGGGLRGDFGRADVFEWKLPTAVLDVLLKDRTTGRNIVWGTRDYERAFGAGTGFGEDDEIRREQIADRERPVIRPRVVKDAAEQRRRSVDHAEVFTPSWVCNAQNNLVDAAWFRAKSAPFNRELRDRKSGAMTWKTNLKRITRFPKGATWTDYVLLRRLEVACGEAPYLTSRYDAVTGAYIPAANRIGILDRKLRLVGENVPKDRHEVWFDMAKWALKSVYAFDWQGDNVLLARENLVYAIVEAFTEDYALPDKPLFTEKSLLELAEIVSWNVWQMDGIRFVVPNSCHDEQAPTPPDLFANDAAAAPSAPKAKPCPGCKAHDVLRHNGTRCKVMNWETNTVEEFLPEAAQTAAGKEVRE